MLLLRVLLALLSWLVVRVLGDDPEFINPPPFRKAGDFSRNHVYSQGSEINVIWSETPAGKKCTLALYQINPNQPEELGKAEILTKNVVDMTVYKWVVGTDRFLEDSNIFFLSYYQEGVTDALMHSNYINITERNPRPPRPSVSVTGPPVIRPTTKPNPQNPDATGSSTSESATTKTDTATVTISQSASLSTGSSNSTTSTTSSTSTTPTTPPTDVPTQPDPPVITITAIIGICVGILVLILIIIIATLFWVRRRRQQHQHHHSSDTASTDTIIPRPNLPEAGDRSPKEIDHEPGLWTTCPELPPQPRSPGELGAPGCELWTARGELPVKENATAELPDSRDRPWVGVGELAVRGDTTTELEVGRGLWVGVSELEERRRTVRYELYG